MFPDLARQLRSAVASKQLTAATTAAYIAIAETHVQHQAVQKAQRRLRTNGASFNADDLERSLELLIEKLDDQYLQLQEAAENGKAGEEEYLTVFAQARSVSALLYAMRGDRQQASLEAVYEALMAVEHKAVVVDAVKSVLCG